MSVAHPVVLSILRICVVVALWITILLRATSAAAQVYSVDVRPSGLSYRVAKTQHFDLIYQSGYEREAARAGDILESALPRARQLTGTGRRLRIPVVLNAYDDRGNGFVTPFPFKMEMEIPALKGNRLSPRHTSWLHAVGRHELVHALHAEYGRGLGAVGLARLFSPDLSRLLNLMVPAGVAEGIAVFMESEGENRPGRLNHSLFQMEFRAAMASTSPWSLAQMLEPPAYSIPADRHYHGGANLYAYLYERDAGDTFRRAQRFHYTLPFFGYGLSLWVGSRRTPWRLGRDFRLQARQDELERQIRLGTITSPAVVATGRGLVHRRPQWLNNAEVVAYVSGYHVVPGFYRIDIASGERVRLTAQRITEDALFTLAPDRRTVVFSRYVQSAVIESRRVAEAFQLELSRNQVTRMTRGGHLFTPAVSRSGQVWGSVDSGIYSRLARLGSRIGYPAVPLPPRVNIKSLAWSPTGDSLAALVNREGVQGLYLIFESEGLWRAQPLVIPGDGWSVMDFSWMPDGSGILFTCDYTGVANLFSVSLRGQPIRQLTNARYGAFEGSVSPDGSQIAYVDYQHERWNLVTLKLDTTSAGQGRIVSFQSGSTNSTDTTPFVAPRDADLAARASPSAARTVDGPSPDAPPRDARSSDAPPGDARSSDAPPRDARSPDAASPAASSWHAASSPVPFAAGLEPDAPATADTLRQLDSRPYRPLRYLAPRALFPLLDYSNANRGTEGVELGLAVGAAVAGSDPLQQLSYVAAGWYQAEKLWGIFTMQSGAILPRPSASVFRTPSTRVVRTLDGVRRVGREEEGATVGGSLPVTLSSNVYRSSVGFGLNAQYSRSRLFDAAGQPITRYERRTTISPSVIAQIATHANRRDIRTRRGFVIGATSLHDVWSSTSSRNAVLVESRLFIPSVSGSGGSFSLTASYLWQSEAAIYDLDRFLPRGLEGSFVPRGGQIKYGVDVVQPLTFVDNGLLILPIYLQSIYLYGFAESVMPTAEASFEIDSVGGGVGVQLRLLYLVNLDLRFGAAYLPDRDEVRQTFR